MATMITLFWNNVREKWEGKVIVVSLLVPVIVAVIVFTAFKTLDIYSVSTIYMMPIELGLILIVPLGVIIGHWDQKDVYNTAQMVLTKPVSRWQFFVCEYMATVTVIGTIVVVTLFLTGLISFFNGYFSWKVVLAFCGPVISILLLEAVMLLLSQVFSRLKTLIIGMAVCLGGLYRLQIGYVLETFVGVSKVSYVLPNLQVGLLTSARVIHRTVPGRYLGVSFLIWVIDFTIVMVAAYYLFSRRDL